MEKVKVVGYYSPRVFSDVILSVVFNLIMFFIMLINPSVIIYFITFFNPVISLLRTYTRKGSWIILYTKCSRTALSSAIGLVLS